MKTHGGEAAEKDQRGLPCGTPGKLLSGMGGDSDMQGLEQKSPPKVCMKQGT